LFRKRGRGGGEGAVHRFFTGPELFSAVCFPNPPFRYQVRQASSIRMCSCRDMQERKYAYLNQKGVIDITSPVGTYGLLVSTGDYLLYENKEWYVVSPQELEADAPIAYVRSFLSGEWMSMGGMRRGFLLYNLRLKPVSRRILLLGLIDALFYPFKDGNSGELRNGQKASDF